MNVLLRRRVGWAAVFVVALCGCRSLLSVSDKPMTAGSPLREARRSSDGVRFEVYWATLPPQAEAERQASLWRFVQEERLDQGLRTRLRRNGLRAGVVGGVPPREIVRLLDPRGDSADASDGVSRLSAPTGVKKQEMTVRPGEPAVVNASEVQPEVSLLLAGEEGPWGETFHQAQAIYKVGIDERPGGGHVVSITPELHHGESRMRWVADETGAITRPRPMRQERAFTDLQIDAPLVVGEMLIVTSLPDSESRLGGMFHRADGEVSGVRKAIVVRLVQTPPDGDFDGAQRADDRPDF